MAKNKKERWELSASAMHQVTPWFPVALVAADSCRLPIVFTAEGPIVFIGVEPRGLHQQLLPLMQPTAITAVKPWRGRHCCMLTHSQKAATVAPPQDQVCPTPTILHTPQIWSCSHYVCPHSRPQLCGCSAHAHATNSDSAASPRVPVPRAGALQQEHPHPRPVASLTELHGDYAAAPSPVLKPPHPTQTVPSHPLVDKDLSLPKLVHNVWKR